MNLKLDITPPTLPLSKGRSEEGLTEFVMNIKKKQLFPGDTKISCPELFQDNRKCQMKTDIIIRRGEVNQETKVNRTFRNGGCQPSIGFWMSDVRGISFAVNYVHPAILKNYQI